MPASDAAVYAATTILFLSSALRNGASPGVSMLILVFMLISGAFPRVLVAVLAGSPGLRSGDASSRTFSFLISVPFPESSWQGWPAGGAGVARVDTARVDRVDRVDGGRDYPNALTCGFSFRSPE